jgi:hypothetical protein
MTMLGRANWWAPRFMRPAPVAPVVERELELVH